MPHALLLSPDDQAVSAITGVLEEMSVTCERPLDGASAAQKLNSHSFDLVLVDCENLPAAKLIFDVCRRGKGGNNPVPIAIVDGRAGLPTAFRLGAELILTKPVAKDQARSTIRTAVSRLRKDVPANEKFPAPAESATTPSAAVTSAVKTEERAQAAAASSQLTNFADPVPSFVPTAAASAAPAAARTATVSAPAITTTTKMHSGVDEIAAPPVTQKSSPRPASLSASSLSDVSELSSARAVPASSKSARPVKPSDDPVLAELEESELGGSELGKAAVDHSVGESFAPVFSSYPQRPQKKRGPLVALLMLALACGGLYAAWTYQPGFRALAQPQIDRVLALAGMALPPQNVPPAPSPAKPLAHPANQTESTVPDSTPSSTTSSATGVAPTAAAATVPIQPAATPGPAVTPSVPGAATTLAPVVNKPEAGKPGDSKKDAAAATSSNGELPGESSAIILSSKGAERRLARSVPPKYPAEARSGEAEGTVVLKAVIDETGKVEGLRLVEGNAVLATAAMQAVKQWRYRPYVRDGKAQPFQTVVIVDFQRP
jgi:periplasmic protein TonB